MSHSKGLREESLRSRIPTSRMSLGAPVSSASSSGPKRKRAHSIAPGENIDLGLSKRHSISRPAKGILKASNHNSQENENPTPTFSAGLSADISDTTVISEFHTTVHDNPSRKSLGGRRVSFAEHAHVRVFESNDQNTNGSSSPNSSPVASPSNSPTAADPSPVESPVSAPQPAPAAPQSPSRRSSVGHRRRSSIHGFEDDGEAPMELSDDGINPTPFYQQQQLQDENGDEFQGSELGEQDMDEDSTMDLTTDFGQGIISRRQSMADGGRRRSRMRSSILPPTTEGGVEPTEFQVALVRKPRESDAFKALKAMANGNRPDTDEETGEDEGGEVDMDVETATSRLLAARARNSVGGDFAFQTNDAGNDSFSSNEDSFDLEDNGDRTMNITSVMGSFRLSEAADTTMSMASVVGDSPTINRIPQELPGPCSRAAAIPHFVASPKKSTPLSPSKKALQPKSPAKQFTAAFAPPFKPAKRSLSTTDDENPVESPAKKRAVATNDVSTKRLSFAVPQSSPVRETLSKGRRPSGFFRKSLGASTTVETPSQPQPPVAQPSPPRRRSVALKTSPKKSAPTPLPVEQEEDDETTDMVEYPSPGQPVITISQPLEEQQDQSRNEEPMVASSQALEQWATTVDGAAIPQEDDIEPISVDNFFTMTGIRFMEDLTCPRRSTIHPSQMQRRESNEGEQSYPLGAYAVAMAVDVAQLETMTWIANDIRSAIEKYKEQYRETEEDAAKDIPPLFREYATAPEEDREEIMYVLKLIKAHTILSAKGSWYAWKCGWVKDLQQNAERTLENLRADELQLNSISSRADAMLPALREEYQSIMRELEEERAAIAEIESCDKDFLDELKGTIAEQQQELEAFQKDFSDGEAKRDRLKETLMDLEKQAEESRRAIKTAQRQMDIQKTSSRAEVFRLRDELNTLQDIHLWRACKLDEDLIEFLYNSTYKVVIPSRRSSPIPEKVEILPYGPPPTNDEFPALTSYMFKLAKRYAVQQDTKVSLRMVIQRLSDFWASYSQLRWQLKFLLVRYPVTCALLPPGASVDEAEGIEVAVTLLLQKKSSKVLVRFYLDDDVIGRWPGSLESLTYDVSVAYGKANSSIVSKSIAERLETASPEENHACLADACMVVVESH